MNIDDYKIYNKGLIFKGAPHSENELSFEEYKILFKSKKALFVRNIFDFDCNKNTSFWFIIKDNFLGMDELKSKVRNQVKRAFKTFDIRIITKDEIIKSGYRVYLSSYERYKDIANSPMSQKKWKEIIMKAGDKVEYWGAYEKDKNELIAYSENLLQDNICKYVALKASPAFLKDYPFYGLLYLMNEHYLVNRKMLYVTDGARSVTEHSNIQSFLEKFLFRKAYCQLKVKYVWWLEIIIKLLFPFRKLISYKKVKYLLKFEAMQRGLL
jgi:hypothetical protein